MDGDSKDYRKVINVLFQVLRPKLYLEVGCRNGETLRYLIDSNPKSNTEFHAIDIRDVKKNLPKKVNFHLGDSSVIGRDWNKEIDLLFIDANHSADAVFNDFLLFSPSVKLNGLILLHDTFPLTPDDALPNNCGDAWKSAWKIRSEMKEFEILTLPIKNGLSIIRKSPTQINWS